MQVYKVSIDPPTATANDLSLVCPYCGKDGTFDSLVGVNDVRDATGPNFFGHRRCPNPKCSAHVFVVINNGKIRRSYPASRIPFSRENVPHSVAEAFDEAITCRANECFVASAIMIRKTLEEICADKGATGSNLKERIDALSCVVILPPEFLEAMHDLRLLGNDGAHIKSKTFNSVSSDEVDIGIEVTKELLHAVYQYSAIIGKLRAMKQQSEPDGNT